MSLLLFIIIIPLEVPHLLRISRRLGLPPWDRHTDGRLAQVTNVLFWNITTDNRRLSVDTRQQTVDDIQQTTDSRRHTVDSRKNTDRLFEYYDRQ